MSGVYEVGIHLSATNGVSGVLAAISKEVLGLNAGVEKLQKGLAGLKMAAIGAVVGAAGGELLKVASHFEHAGEKIVHAKTQFEAALPAQERMAAMAKITAAAWKEAGDNLRTNVTENIEAIHDLYNVTTNVPHAIELLPAFNTLKNVQDSVREHGGQAASNKDIASAIRGFELSGRVQTEELKKIAVEFAKTSVALRGRVTGGMLQTQIQNAGPARFGWDDEFLGRDLPILAANGLGGRTGSALYHLRNNLFGGVSSSMQQMEGQVKWGLNDWGNATDPAHKKPGFRVASGWNADLLSKNPIEWANEYLKFLHDQKHVDTQNKDTMQKIVAEIARGNKQLQSALDELLLPSSNRQLNKERGNVAGVGDDAFDIQNSRDPKAVRDALKKQFENALEGMGEQLVQPFMDRVLKPLTNVFKEISQWAAVNPETVKNIGTAVAGLGAAMAVMGALAIGAGIAALVPGGAAALAVAGVVGILGALAAVNWEKLKQAKAEDVAPFLENMGKNIADDFKSRFGQPFMQAMSDLANSPGTKDAIETLKKVGAQLGEAMSSMAGLVKGPAAACIDALNFAAKGIGSALSALASAAKSALGKIYSAGSGPTSTSSSGLPSFDARASGGPVTQGRGYMVGEHGPEFFTPGAHGYITAAHMMNRRSAVPPHHARTSVINVQTAINLDGRKVGQMTSRHMARAALHPTAIGGMDNHGTYAPPGAVAVG